MIEMRQFATYGRSLVAGQPFYPGDVVLVEEQPILRWNPDALIKCATEEESAILALTQTPPFLAASAFALLKASDVRLAMRTMCEMTAPNLPISSASYQLYSFCREVLRLYPEAASVMTDFINAVLQEKTSVPFGLSFSSSSPPQDNLVAALVHCIMAAKTNAHRAKNGDWCLYAKASKLAHSCDPNLIFVAPCDAGRVQFIASRNIQHGEILTFSYLGGPLLAAATGARIARLQTSHLFACQCPRCQGADSCRQLLCPKRCAPGVSGMDVAWTRLPHRRPGLLSRQKTQSTLTENDVFPNGVWRCEFCESGFSDSALAQLLDIEANISKSVDEIDAQHLRLGDLRDLACDAAAELGCGHYAFASLCHYLSMYYKALSKTAGVQDAVVLCIAWELRYLDALCTMKVERKMEGSAAFPHMLTGSVVMGLAIFSQEFAASPGVAKFQPLLAHLAKLCLPLLRAFPATTDKEKAQLALLASVAQNADAYPPLNPVPPADNCCHVQVIIWAFCPTDVQRLLGLDRPLGPNGRTYARHREEPSVSPGSSNINLPEATEYYETDVAPLFDLWDKAVAMNMLRRAMVSGSSQSQSGDPFGTSMSTMAASALGASVNDPCFQ